MDPIVGTWVDFSLSYHGGSRGRRLGLQSNSQLWEREIPIEKERESSMGIMGNSWTWKLANRVSEIRDVVVPKHFGVAVESVHPLVSELSGNARFGLKRRNNGSCCT